MSPDVSPYSVYCMAWVCGVIDTSARASSRPNGQGKTHADLLWRTIGEDLPCNSL
jgi:hypothetical protein